MNSVKDHWDGCHLNQQQMGLPASFYLSSYKLNQYLELFQMYNKYSLSNTILEVGIGNGNALQEMYNDNKTLYALDIVQNALNKVKNIAKTYLIDDIQKIPKNSIDIIFCHLVVQHINNDMFEYHLKNIIPCLNESGVYCIQYRENLNQNIDSKDFETEQNCKLGDVLRTPVEVENLINTCGGKVLKHYIANSGNDIEFGGKWIWQVVIIQKQ